MLSEEFIIGDCQPDEIRQIALLEREVFSVPWTEEMFRQEASSSLSRMLVVRKRERVTVQEVLGYLIFWQVSDEFHLQKIAVKSDLRRRGIGSALLAQAFEEAAQFHCRHATLEVRRSNHAAIRFYKRFGFTVEGIRPRYYDDTGEDALILWADLPGACRGDHSRSDRGIPLV